MNTLIMLLILLVPGGASGVTGSVDTKVHNACTCSVNGVMHIHGERTNRAWGGIDANDKRQITQYVTVTLGLSSTGRIELTRALRQVEYAGFAQTGDLVLQFDQIDLFGDRLFWSYLVNTTNGKTIRLFPIAGNTNGPREGRWREPQAHESEEER